jgi:hypothetical protein
LIIRISRGRVRTGAEAEVFGRLRDATEGRGRPDGLEALFIGRHLTADGLELIAITAWTDVEALIRVLGEGWEAPKWLDGVEELVTHSTVEHWETAVDDFDAFIGPWDAASAGGVAEG